ncbi:hypothetical protein [Sciscionella sediminilitoris]|uniref:hypothetical protein n=1 Tax=Sciscionella sediminilitoris TaxID=1445613 RepID=UPI00068AB6C7|nr:hypothetical protein [Sciscionella sp. SE31]
MRRLRLLVVPGVLGLLVSALPALAAAESAPGPESCARDLDCDIATIDRMSMPDRLDFVRAMEAGPAVEAMPGHDAKQWRNIEGIIMAFRNHGAGARGTWVSLTDAGILEGVERGLGIATGRSQDTGGNPGAKLWARFITGVGSGELDARSAHDKAWSTAEQASTEYGDKLAKQRGELPNAAEQRFYTLTDIYRFVVRNRPAFLDSLSASGPLAGPDKAEQRQNFFDWATDTTNIDAGRTGGELLWQLSQADLPNSASGTFEVFKAYLDYLFPKYQEAMRNG